jgi:hypothetical protein
MSSIEDAVFEQGFWLFWFEQGPEGTKVHTWGDIVHSGVTIGRKVEHLVTSFAEMW